MIQYDKYTFITVCITIIFTLYLLKLIPTNNNEFKRNTKLRRIRVIITRIEIPNQNNDLTKYTKERKPQEK